MIWEADHGPYALNTSRTVTEKCRIPSVAEHEKTSSVHYYVLEKNKKR